MLIIGEVVVDDAVTGTDFCCDLKQCKGACCTLEGGRGAPLEDDEALEIEKAYPIVKKYLDEENIRTIAARGLYEGTKGDFSTTCIERRACVFVYYDEGIARCSFEKAFLNGEIDWRKPVSCHLFPIRVRSDGGKLLRYEQIEECAPGRLRGSKEQVALVDFLKEPLVRKYGEAWYRKLVTSKP